MRAWRLLLITVWLLTACGGTTPTGVAPAGVDRQPTSTLTPNAASATETGSAAPTGVPSPVLPLIILAPEDEAVVNVSEVEVVGQTAPNAVISLNDEIAVADASGNFTAVVPLVEGPNNIEIVVSDADGNTINLELTVTYEPGS